MKLNLESLNPCSNGRCSAREIFKRDYDNSLIVLIRVLMEDALRVEKAMNSQSAVLILVLMEDALRELKSVR